MTPAWFLGEIVTGLQKLFSLSLDRTPAADVIEGTARTWVEALTYGRTWDERRDAPRLRVGFARLEATAQRWPTPRELLEALPPVDPDRALTHDHGIPETREARARRLQLLLGDDYNPATADPDFDPAEAHGLHRHAARAWKGR